MKKIYFHIGLPKTGTTLLQSAFKILKPNFRDEKIELVDFDLFSSKIREGILPDCKGLFRNLNNKLAIDSQILISSEFLSGIDSTSLHLLPVKQIARMIKDTAGEFFDVKIIIYLRRIDLWIESLYTQFIHDGGRLGFHDFLDKWDFYNFDFSNIIIPYEEVFGKKNLIIKLYDKMYLPMPNSIFKNFADIINSESLRQFNAESLSAKESNFSMSAVDVKIASLCHSYSTGEEQKQIINILKNASKKTYKSQRNIFFPFQDRKLYLQERQNTLEHIRKDYFYDSNRELFSPLVEKDLQFSELQLEDAIRTLMFCINNSFPQNQLCSLKILYNIEMLLKRNPISRTIGKKLISLFKILGLVE